MTIDDTGEWLTYVEAGKRLGITAVAARQLSRRRGWERRTPNAYGVQAQILVPKNALEQPLHPNTDGVRTGDGERGTSQAMFALDRTIRALESAIEVLREQLAKANQRADAERCRVDELLTALADARSAERIAAGEAAALRNEIDQRRSRGGWRQWFR